MSQPTERPVRVRACANIALVKYWGKREASLNLPAAGSLSLTLDALRTTTAVRFVPGAAGDTLVLDGRPVTGRALVRLSRWLDIVRERAGIDHRAEVVSENDFPTASGLASSASGFAALAVAASRAAGLELDRRELSILARRGSGSAARSIHGGFVRMHAGQGQDGADAYAEPVAGAPDDRELGGELEGEDGWPVRMVVAIVGGGREKTHGSRDAMEHCAETSPLYRAWLESVPGDLEAAEAAIQARDMEALGEVTEASALCMHAAAMASRPGIVYFEPATLACMAAVQGLRADGVQAYHTMDAGPHVKTLCLGPDAEAVRARLGSVPGVTEVLVSGPGAGVVVLDPG